MTDADAFAATTAVVVTTDATAAAATTAVVAAADAAVTAETTAAAAETDAAVTAGENGGRTAEENGRTDGSGNGKTVMTGSGMTAVAAETNSRQGQCLRRRQDLQDLRLRIADVIDPGKNSFGTFNVPELYPCQASGFSSMNHTTNGAASMTG